MLLDQLFEFGPGLRGESCRIFLGGALVFRCEIGYAAGEQRSIVFKHLHETPGAGDF